MANFGSQYPPGVTGNERQIRGNDEGTMKRECSIEADFNIFTEDMKCYAANLEANLKLGNQEAIIRNAEWLIKAINTPTFTVYGVCEFEGLVDVEMNAYNIYWTCPICGTEHEEDHDYGE